MRPEASATITSSCRPLAAGAWASVGPLPKVTGTCCEHTWVDINRRYMHIESSFILLQLAGHQAGSEATHAYCH